MSVRVSAPKAGSCLLDSCKNAKDKACVQEIRIQAFTKRLRVSFRRPSAWLGRRHFRHLRIRGCVLTCEVEIARVRFVVRWKEGCGTQLKQQSSRGMFVVHDYGCPVIKLWGCMEDSVRLSLPLVFAGLGNPAQRTHSFNYRHVAS